MRFLAALRATVHERLRDVEELLQSKQAGLIDEKRFPLCLSDASASSCDVEFQLRGGLINCLVWGGKGVGWESRCEKSVFLRCHFILKMIILPRQARDRHRENSKKAAFFAGPMLMTRGAKTKRRFRQLFIGV
jgi:hypothetical protein